MSNEYFGSNKKIKFVFEADSLRDLVFCVKGFVVILWFGAGKTSLGCKS